MHPQLPVAMSLVILFALPLLSSGAEPGTINSSVAFDGNGSVTWLLNVSDSSSHVIAKANATLHGASLDTVAIWFSYASNHTKYDSTWSTDYWGDSHASLQLPPPVGKVLSGRVLGGVEGGRSYWDDVLELPPGSYRIVVMVAGDDGLTGNATLIAPASAQIEVAKGPAFYARSYEFGSGTNIEVKTLASLRYIENASVDEVSHGRIFAGFYGWSNSGILDMAVKGPTGDWGGETQYLLTDEPPGPYRFSIVKNIDASPWPCFYEEPLPVCSLPNIWAFGADALI